ncbi:MAG TPA: phenylalanine--tRNA ligase subunit alpha, partial [Candidatus Bathyarchaeia archaeon]|nr:phenylalanine--tRNA ligase subunit alpha [Candidatus Bathyarchaeia archaeon]
MDLGKIQNLKSQAISNILEAKDEQELEEVRISYLGRKGEITRLIKKLPSLDPEEKRELGRLLNDLKKAIEDAIENQRLGMGKKRGVVKKEWLDVTAPGKKPLVGHIHPVTQIIWELSEVFEQMGYQIMEGPEIENE